MQEAKQTFPGNADGEDDHFREIVVKGTVKREEDENSLVDSVVLSLIHISEPTRPY